MRLALRLLLWALWAVVRWVGGLRGRVMGCLSARRVVLEVEVEVEVVDRDVLWCLLVMFGRLLPSLVN